MLFHSGLAIASEYTPDFIIMLFHSGLAIVSKYTTDFKNMLFHSGLAIASEYTLDYTLMIFDYGLAIASKYTLNSYILLFVAIILARSDFCVKGIDYFKDWTNNVHNLALLVCTVVFLLSDVDNDAGLHYWQWQLGCLVVFLAWIDLLISLQMMCTGTC